MRHALLFCSIIYSTILFAQEPDPNLFQTWYLQTVYASDATPEPYIVSEISPSITPTLTIQPDLTFSGLGACNSFSGTFLTLSSEQIETDQFSFTEVKCEFAEHNSFENEYFYFLEFMAFYTITTGENGMTLSMSTPIFGNAIFQNLSLNVTEYNLPVIELYPNPSNSIINLTSVNSSIIGVNLFNSIGERMEVIQDNFATVDISDLPTGLYLIKIITESGTVDMRIIKE